MGQIFYERPREKLRSRGVSALTRIELLQLIIGAGNTKVSGAKLAREVDTLISNATVTYETLIGIDGLGDAKVCQVLGALELARRM